MGIETCSVQGHYLCLRPFNAKFVIISAISLQMCRMAGRSGAVATRVLLLLLGIGCHD